MEFFIYLFISISGVIILAYILDDLTSLKSISHIKVGDIIKGPKNGRGIITAKTKLTLTATFETGTIMKITYNKVNDYFKPSDF